MAKINFTVWNTNAAGGTRAIFEIANGLAKRNHHVTITALYGSHSWFSSNNIDIKYLTRKGEYVFLSELNGFLNVFSAFKLDLSNTLIKNAPDCDVNIATWYLTAFPVLLSGKGLSYYFMQDFPEQFSKRDDFKLFKATLQLPFHFLTNSEYAKNVILSMQPTAEVKKVGVGVNLHVFHPRPKKKLVYDDRKTVMCLLYPWAFKGSHIALKVLNLVNKTVPIHAILVGAKLPLENYKKSNVIAFPYTYHRFVTDEQLADLYSSTDVFLFTSYAESFGLPPLEAMACGNAVVTTDCKGNRDYTVSEHNCIVTPTGDVDAIVQGVIKALTNDGLAKSLGQGGIETAKQWTWGTVLDKVECALKNF